MRTDGAVFAAPFDLESLALTGTGVPLFEGVQINISTPQLAVGDDGTVLYQSGATSSAGATPVWVDRQGSTTAVDSERLPNDTYHTFALSPSGDRLAISTVEQDSDPQLWVKQLPDGPLERLTTGGRGGIRPEWSPDGSRVAFISGPLGSREVRIIRSDGSSPSELLISRDLVGLDIEEIQYVPGRSEILLRAGTAGETLLGLYDPDTDSVRTLLEADGDQWMARLSPDGRWLAYVSDHSGTDQVYVRPFPGMDAQTQISTTMGESPVWAHNGSELFYEEESVLTVARYETTPGFRVTGRSEVIDFELEDFFRPGNNWKSFDVAPGDQRIISLQNDAAMSADASADVVYIRDFFTELQDRLPN